MRGGQEVCMQCRNAIRFSGTIPSGRRPVSSRSRPLDTFNASKLLLDLDAADSKYVRRYEDEQEDGEVMNPTVPPPTSAKRSRQRKEGMNDHEVLKKKPIPADIYRATGADYLAFALLGPPWHSSSRSNSRVQKLLKANSISTRLGTFADQVGWLKHNAELPYDPASGLLPPYGDNGERFRRSILRCKNIYDLTRATALITQTSAGSKYLSSNGEVILAAIRRYRLKGAVSSTGVLKFLNAITQKLETMDADLGRDLCEAGMYYAAKARVLPALHRYIEIATANKYPVGERRAKALGVAVRRFEAAWEEGAPRNIRFGDVGRRDLLRLLTGWESKGIPQAGEDRKPCFADLVQQDPQMYSTYITGLGKQGATEALWHEWTHPNLTPSPTPPAEAPKSSTFMARTDLFVDAFLTASDPWPALHILENSSPTSSDQSMHPTPLHHSIPGLKNHQASKITIGQQGKLRTALLAHYERHGIVDFEGERLQSFLAKLGDLEISDPAPDIADELGRRREATDGADLVEDGNVDGDFHRTGNEPLRM